MGHLAGALAPERAASISNAIERYYETDSLAAPGKHHQRRERLIDSVRQTRQRTEARLEQLRVQAAKGEQAERWRRFGELIYAYLWMIAPGQSELLVEDERVPLDPALNAKENAQAYFERYRKAQSAGQHVPELVTAAEHEVGYLDQLLTHASLAKTFPEIEEVAAEWELHRGAPDEARPAGKKPRSTPKRRIQALTDRNGNLIYVGRSGIENDRVAFDVAGPNDTWLHARGVPGSHVVVKWADAAGGEDEDTVDTAAALAAYYSRNRESGSVEVDVTRRRYVRKIKGTGPGLATYRNERTIAVRPADEGELVKLGRLRSSQQ
jgi:predicted ribosome quality control (RQC) complex YloA/Tae2 family protein